jgi:hypothetical protein
MGKNWMQLKNDLIAEKMMRHRIFWFHQMIYKDWWWSVIILVSLNAWRSGRWEPYFGENKRNSDTRVKIEKSKRQHPYRLKIREEKNLQVINNHHHEYNNNVLSLKTFFPLHSHFKVHTVKKKSSLAAFCSWCRW